jgi:hypothetical protein
MKDKTISEAMRRQDWTSLNAFEKFGLVTLFVFFAYMIYMFFILPKL